MPKLNQKDTQPIIKAELESYSSLLADIRALIKQAQGRAYQAVDNIRVQTYWQIGERIVRASLEHQDRAEYGQEVIKRLAVDLEISERNLYNAVAFYRAYPILQTVSAELSWSHYVELTQLNVREERRFYEVQAIRGRWSVRELRKNILSDLYQQAKVSGELVTTMPLELPFPSEAFKDVYQWDFLKLKPSYTERELEDALIASVERLLLELGPDFYLGGRQQKMIIDGQIHTVDLEFYHRGLQCIVLVDLKRGPFKSDYVGQMNKYLNYYKENKRYEWEKPPIGLIICEHKGVEEVRYALGDLEEKIFVAEYKLRLPKEEEIKHLLSAGVAVSNFPEKSSND